ncbi:hypothetical protein DM860_012035 [Cuscuta australis]|uniref:AP2/ERF domain-containing protein n=1 Tax=Cuscuta australis TaxID=267555 RepID=A0A328D8R1_9ASTE|nr:hypothetical protein DM860_012035 [Cuscuta australis]
MVSIRRRRLLGLCSSGRSSCIAQFAKFPENGCVLGNFVQNTKPNIVYPLPSNDLDQPKEETATPGSSSLPASPPSKDQENQKFSEVKRRKRQKRKQIDSPEPCLMRGVYFKNMKWQAAIKVDKKQIHLGTVGSQEEAARLYDRAAFMCGREPNFEIPEEEKEKLRKLDWEEFLAVTRSAITSKKTRRRVGIGAARRKPEPWAHYSEEDDVEQQQGNGLSASEDTSA